MPPRVTPRTRLGGQDDFEKRIVRGLGRLGWVVGFLIFFFTASLIAVDTLLNPIFLFAQAKASGIAIGTPIGAGWLAWWTVALVTLCTTGIQYAFFQEGTRGWGIGRIVGIIIMVMDTVMDGGGFLAWQGGGSKLTNLSGDASHLRWGMFPAPGSKGGEWFVWGVICFICAFHELFLGKVLGMVTFTPAIETDPMNLNIAKWIHRAGSLLLKVKLVVLNFTPYIMLGLDVILFPQSQRGQDGGTQFVWVFVTGAVTLATLALWRYYTHLRVEGNYKLSEMDRFHQFMFLGAVALSGIDSAYDLRGFNEAVYHQAGFVPQGLPSGGIQQWALTAGIVMLMCTAFAPMYSHLFGPVGVVAARIPGYDMGWGSLPIPVMPDMGGGGPVLGGESPFDGFEPGGFTPPGGEPPFPTM